jgi:hypothetical protein
VHGSDEVVLVSPQGRMQRRLRVGDGPHGIAAIQLTSP